MPIPGRCSAFPHGDVNSRVLADVKRPRLCGGPLDCGVARLGRHLGGQTVQKVTHRVLAAAQPGEIVLMHLGSSPADSTTLDAAALLVVTDGLRARGYGFVTYKR